MAIIIVNNTFFKTHPIFELYASSLDGKIINVNKKNPFFGNKSHNGYLTCSVKKNETKQKSCQAHRFIWECWCGLIPEGKVIDHIDNNKANNQLCNLRLMTHQQNCKKSAKNRDYKFAANNCKNRKC